MSGFPIVDLVIGIIFINFLLSVICSSIVEMILTVKKVRSKILEDWLLEIFSKQITDASGKLVKLGQAIMDHCSVTALSAKRQAPSYISAKNFASALLEKISFDPVNPQSVPVDLNGIIQSVKNTNGLSTELQRVLLSYAYEVKNTAQAASGKLLSEMDLFRTKVEDWYDSTMDRLTGTLVKNYARPFTIIVSIAVVLMLNADSLAISRYLYSNPDVRAKVAAQAYNLAQDSLDSFNQRIVAIQAVKDSASIAELKTAYNTGMKNIGEAKAALEDDIPLGWNSKVFIDKEGKTSGWLILSKLVGLTATVLAVLMGAPFWFDLLNKLANLRGAGPKPIVASSESKVP